MFRISVRFLHDPVMSEDDDPTRANSSLKYRFVISIHINFFGKLPSIIS